MNNKNSESNCDGKKVTNEVLFSWECIPPREKLYDIVVWSVSIVVSVVASIFFHISLGSEAIFLIIPAIIVSILLALYSSATVGKPKVYNYELTKDYINVKYRDDISDDVFKAVRFIAWIGVFICIIAAAVVGPLAFVGAGGAALGAFSLTGFKNKTYEYEKKLSDDISFCYYQAGRKMFFWPTRRDSIAPEEFRTYSSSIHCDHSDYEQLIFNLEKIVDNLRLVKEVEKEKYLYDYVD